MTISETSRWSPYQGLDPYSEADAPFFFGREKETRLIIANLFASPLTLLYGASGVGKSSVLRAGVTHQLRQRNDVFVVSFNKWQVDPVSDLKAEIAEASAKANFKIASPSEFPSLADYLVECATKLDRRLMIILDQFEEYFLYHPQDDAFADQFPQALLHIEQPISFLIAIREDALAKLDRFEGRVPNLFDNYLRIANLDRESARAAIVKPIAQFNRMRSAEDPEISVESSLVDSVLQQVEAGQVTLGETGRGMIKAESTVGQVETPYLQLVMTRLWDKEMHDGSRVLRLKTLVDLGGAERIVRTHLDTTMNALPKEEQDIAAEVFHYLVTPSGTKIAHTVGDLAQYAESSEARIEPVMEKLASGDNRVLRGVAPPSNQGGEQRYEIFHDVLATAVLDWRMRHEQKKQLIKVKAEESARRLKIGLIAASLLLVMMGGVSAYAFNQRAKALAAANEAQRASDELKRVNEDLGKESNNLKLANENLEKQKSIAEEQKGIADEQKGIADEQRGLAEKREAEAIAARKLAVDATERAIAAAAAEKKNRMGLIEARAGHTEEAIRLFQDANSSYEKVGDSSGRVSALASIAETYADVGGIPSFAVVYQSAGSDQVGSLTGADTSYVGFVLEIIKKASGKSEDAKKALADNRSQTVVYYEKALALNNKNSDPKTEALILKRLGDIALIQSFEATQAGEIKDAETYFQQGIEKYSKASEAYDRAILLTKDGSALRIIHYDKANTLRTAADALDNLLGNTQVDTTFKRQVDEITGYYSQAAESYEKANKPNLQAATLLKLGDLYRRLPKNYVGTPVVIETYKQAAKIYNQLNRADLEAPIYKNIADLVITESANVDEALASYKMAFEAYVRAASQYKENEDMYYAAADGILNDVVFITNSRPEDQQKADAFFVSALGTSRDPVRTAHLLNVIGNAYSLSEPAPKTRYTSYRERELKSLVEARLFYEAAQLAFLLVADYNTLANKGKVVESFDQALSLYRESILGPDSTPKKARLITAVTNAGKILDDLGEKQRAAEAYEEELKLSLEPGSSVLFYNLIPLSKIYIEQNDLQNAERVFRTVIDKEFNKAKAFRDVGDLYAASKYTDKAMSYYERSISLTEERYEDPSQIPFQKKEWRDEALETLRQINKTLIAEGDKSRAIAYFDNSAARAQQAKKFFREATARELLAEIYSAEAERLSGEDKSKAINLALQSYGSARSTYHELKDIYAEAGVLDAMSNLYAMNGDKVTAEKLKTEAVQLFQVKPN